MIHPQTTIHEIKRKFTLERLEAIEKYGCCAFVLLWCLHIEPDDLSAIDLLCDMMSAGVIEKDCTVHWLEAVKFLTGREISVEFRDIKDLRGLKDRTPVRYDYKGQSHWVGVEKGMICYNPLEYSQRVEKGRPVTARIITFKK